MLSIAPFYQAQSTSSNFSTAAYRFINIPLVSGFFVDISNALVISQVLTLFS
jgi:sodium--glutamate symport carrier gltS